MAHRQSRRRTLRVLAAAATVGTAGCVGFGPGASDDPDVGVVNRDDARHEVGLSVDPAGGNAVEEARKEVTLDPDERATFRALLPYYDARSTYRVGVAVDGEEAAERTVRVDGPEEEVGDLRVVVTGPGSASIEFGPEVDVDADGWL
ncbi:MAG: hypothetical protein V5A60_05180 [Haloarculaceae archaeon]